MPSTDSFIPVVICGGSGARLWPLSRELLAKPFVELPGGGTMIGELLASLRDLGCPQAVIVTTAEQLAHCQGAVAAARLPFPVSFIAEPAGRNTAPAIAAAARLLFCTGLADVPMAVLPADQHVKDRDLFNQALLEAAAAAQDGGLVLLGIEPAAPATGYGYIRAAGSGRLLQVDKFIEKPSAQKARQLIDAGDCYWNAGIFVAPPATFARLFAEHAPQVAAVAGRLEPDVQDGSWQLPAAVHEEFPRISFDYAVAEQVAGLAMVPVAAAGWSDLGDWDQFCNLLPQDAAGNRTAGETLCEATANASVMAASGRLVVAAGCDGINIVDMPDALLVSGAGHGAAVRAAYDKLAAARDDRVRYPALERRPWGRYQQEAAGPGWKVKRIEVEPQRQLSLQSHKHRSEVWTVVEGVMTVTIDASVKDLAPGESCHIPQGAKHRMANRQEARAVLVEVQIGAYLGEDDIVRYEDDFGRG